MEDIKESLDRRARVTRILNFIGAIQAISLGLAIIILISFLPVYPAGFIEGRSSVMPLVVYQNPKLYLVISLSLLVVFIIFTLIRLYIKRNDRMFDQPIKSVQQAKEYFRSMGCSHFHMVRENLPKYKGYERMNISKQLETEWRIEQLDEYYNNNMRNKDNEPLWLVHSKMSELVETLRTEPALIKILEVTQHICDRVPLRDRIIVSETINGRQYREFRSGLIYLSYDLDHIPIAKDFAELSLYFAAFDEQKGQDFERCQSATKLCNDIKIELSL